MAQVFHNDFSNGDIVEYEVSATVTSGVPTALGLSGIVGIPLIDGVSGDKVAMKLNGVARLPKAATAFTAGTAVDWDISGGNLVASSGDYVDKFIPIQDAASGDAEALVLMV